MLEALTPSVCIITPGDASEENFLSRKGLILEIATAAADCGADILQIREKNLPTRLLSELVDAVIALTAGAGLRIVVNDRADVAATSGAAGVHLTAESVDASDVRLTFGEDFLIGASTHSIEDVRAAKEKGCDYVFFGPVFDTPSKRQFGPPQGLELLRQAVEAAESLAVFALGGIDLGNARSALDAGASGVAAIRLFADPERVREAVAEIKSLRVGR